MEDYKQEVISSRRGCLGSSDGKLLRQIAELGSVPKSALKRLAVVKGLTEATNVSNAAMRAGDQMEMAIFTHLSMAEKGYESNPLWVSRKWSMRNVKLISHPDIVHVDEKKKVLYVYEVKTTKYSAKDTRDHYREQLWIHYCLAKEEAGKMGPGWKVKLFLVHYDTSGLDLEEGVDFDADRVSVHPVRFSYPVFDIGKAMRAIDEFLDTFDEYYEGDEIDSVYLPEKVREDFNAVTTMLMEIKEREDKISEFKTRLYDFMLEKDIKSIKSDFYSITRVDPTESIKVDYKAIFDEWASKHPRLSQKASVKHGKVQKRKGYATIKLRQTL